MSGVFDDERDNRQMAVNAYFYCYGHLTAAPLSEQSEDKRYCQNCYKVIQNEKRIKNENSKNKDYWRGNVFIHQGKSYGVTAEDCRTVLCDTDPSKMPSETLEMPSESVTHGELEKNITVTFSVTDRCLICGGILPNNRAKYCSAKCRMKAHRARNKMSQQFELTEV